MTAVTFLRVRDRLNKSGLQLELYAESDGFRWDIAGRPLGTRRVFPTVQAALDHADMYTYVWYGEKREGTQRSPAGQPTTVHTEAASWRSPTSAPVSRLPRRRFDALLHARRRAWNSA
jgi:hypothetical protein